MDDLDADLEMEARMIVDRGVPEDYGRSPHERHIQEQILEWRATGASDAKIAEDLNACGWMARGGDTWNAAMVRKAYPDGE